MQDILKEQTCPYCGYTEDPSSSTWTEGESVEQKCDHCGKTYLAKAVYDFLGWDCSKICDVCGEGMDDCLCGS